MNGKRETGNGKRETGNGKRVIRATMLVELVSANCLTASNAFSNADFELHSDKVPPRGRGRKILRAE